MALLACHKVIPSEIYISGVGDIRVFHRFGQAKIHNGGSALGSSQFLLLSQLPQKTTLASKVVKNRLKNYRLASFG